jgi:HEPN domain-containing protein
MRNQTRSWIVKGDKDLGTASFALESVDGPLPVTACLHCQQSAGKYLKAFLQENDASFSLLHNLTSLLESCVALDNSFESLRMDISQLEGYSIASRYPKNEGSLDFGKEALASANRVKKFVLGKLNQVSV